LAEPLRKCFPKADFGFDRVQALAAITDLDKLGSDAQTNIANANAMLAI
jgi:hypothetical protein